MSKELYTVDNEWNGFSIRRGQTGWLIAYWSRVQGQRTNWEKRVEYDLYPYLVTCDNLDLSWNDTQTIGDYLAYAPLPATTTKPGHIVE